MKLTTVRYSRRLILALVAFGSMVALLSVGVALAAPGWGTPKTVDNSRPITGWHSSLAVDDASHPVIAYGDDASSNTTGALHFVRAADTTGLTWNTPITVTATANHAVGLHAALLVVNHNPAIFYTDVTSGTVWYVRANDTTGTTWGAPVQIDSSSDFDTGFGGVAAIVSGQPATVYQDQSLNQLMFVRANNLNGTSWGTPLPIDNNVGNNLNDQPSLAVVNNNPAVSYYEATITPTARLKFVRAGDVNGTNWTTTHIDVTGALGGGQFSSLAVVNGLPAIKYFDEQNLLLKYIQAGDANGDTWNNSPVLVDSGNAGFQDQGLTVVNNVPAIAYVFQGAPNWEIRYVRAQDADGVTWDSPVVLDSGVDAEFPSIAVVSGQPAVSYVFGSPTNELRYVRAPNATGSTVPANYFVPQEFSAFSSGTAGSVSGNAITVANSGGGSFYHLPSPNTQTPGSLPFDSGYTTPAGNYLIEWGSTSSSSTVTFTFANALTPAYHLGVEGVDQTEAVSITFRDAGNALINPIGFTVNPISAQSTPVVTQTAAAIILSSDSGADLGEPLIEIIPNVATVKQIIFTGTSGDGVSTVQAYVSQSKPPLSAAFSPVGINSVETSTLTVTVSSIDGNPVYQAAFTDNLPSGLRVASPPNAVNTCGNGSAVAASAGGTSLGFSGFTLPYNNQQGDCAVAVVVTNQVAQTNDSCLGSPAAFTNDASNLATSTFTQSTVVPSCLIVGSLDWGAVRTVDASNGNTGYASSLAVVNGNPAISYVDQVTLDLNFVRATNSSGTAWGAPQTVASGASPNTALTVVSGNPAIAYEDGAGNLIYVRASNANGTAWGTPVTLDTGTSGDRASLLVVNGQPAVAYQDANTQGLKYVRALDATGATWGSPAPLDSAANHSIGFFSSLAIVGGNPAIAYEDLDGNAGTFTLKYVRATDANGGAWGTREVADPTTNSGDYASLAEVNGLPAISYQHTDVLGNHSLRFIRATNVGGSAWSGPATVDANNDTGWFGHLVIANGNPAISYVYRNPPNADAAVVRYARATDANGTAWANPLTVDAGTDRQNTSMALLFGVPAAAYEADGQLRFAWQGLTQPTVTSFSPTSAGQGATVTITGTNFYSVTAVSFGGTPAATFGIVSATELTATVGAGASGSVSVTTSGGSASLAGFTFIPAPTVVSFSPTSAGQGATITITGTNFVTVAAVAFGGTPAASFSVVSSSKITATVGAGATGSVSVTTPGGTGSLAGFTFVPAPTVTSFSPTSAGAGATIVITGTNLSTATAVSFGGTPAASFGVASATQITATVGAGTSGSVSVTTLGGSASLAGFTFVPAPTVTSFSPTSAAAGATIVITGTNFTTASAVTFGGVNAATFGVVSATQITATVAANSSSGSVAVTTLGGTASLPGFVFLGPPSVSSFSPTSAGQGATVTITGTNFVTVTAVSFGGTPAASFGVLSPNKITATVGAGASGSVTVTTSGGSASLAGFTFIPAPTVTSFSPTSAAAGATIVITGTDLSTAFAVSFGGTPATSLGVVSATRITATVGAGTSGVVSVTTLGGSASLAGFTFIPAPTVTSFSPTSAPAGATIIITGTNFTNVSAVSFGGTPAASFGFVSATRITATVGTGTSGSVAVTTPGGTGSLAGFTFIPAPTITSFSPTSAGQGTTVTITGTNFTNASAVSFGGTPAASFGVVSATRITATVGSGASGSVAVTTPGGTASLAGFTFVPPTPMPTVTSFSPTAAGVGDTITITGTNFIGVTAVTFGGTPAATYQVVSPTVITATVGAGSSGQVAVTTLSGTGSLNGFIFLQYRTYLPLIIR